MRLERGFRRIVIVSSVLLLGLGIAFDVVTFNPHATVQVTLKDGRKFTVERHASKEDLTDRASLAYALKNGTGEYKGGLKEAPALAGNPAKDIPNVPPPDWVSSEDAAGIANVEYVRGPEYRWWTDSGGTKFSAGAVLFFWIAFYTIRWIARGFTRQ